MGDDTPAALGALQVDETKLRGHADEVVRSSVEEALNGLLDAEADEICQAQRYERTADRVDGRAGHYERKLETKAGAVKLRVPKLRRQPFETAIIERYKRREASVEEALVEIVLGGGVGAQSGGHHRSVVGDAGELRHCLAAEPEDLSTH